MNATRRTILTCFMTGVALTGSSNAGLFDAQAPTHEWAQFTADGYPQPVSGIIFTPRDDVCAGMPLGALGTGCLDLETSGVLGFSSIFQPSIMVEPTPYQTLRNAQLLTPFLGIAVGGRTWVLASPEMIEGGTFRGCIDPVDPGKYTENETYMAHWRVTVRKTEDVQPAKEIRYWGHYPIADLDYTTDAPVAVSLRAWASFLPGDAVASSAPAAVFEVRLRNSSDKRQTGKIAFNFPGPCENEAGSTTFRREVTTGNNWQAVEVAADRARYAIGVLSNSPVEFGGNLSVGGKAWSQIATKLPTLTETDGGASAAVSFDLPPGQSTTIRFVLAWWVKDWLGGAYDEIKHFDETWTNNDFVLSRVGRYDRSKYVPNYSRRYASPIDVVRELSSDHASRLERIIAWQAEVYNDESLPTWLRSALVNNLSQFAEDSLWAAPKGEIAGWAAPLGAFQMTECPRTCAIVGCTASNYY
jgi:uncharacterized protein (DUF608 family)